MTRHHTIGYPRKWLPSVISYDGVTSGYFAPGYQEDVAFTPEEEASRDAEELQAEKDRNSQQQRQGATIKNREAARRKLLALGLTDREISALFGQ